MPEAHSKYYERDKVARAIASNQHREFIGGMCDEIGPLQIQFLERNGLTPHSTLLDIGCGSLRLGVHAAEYLNAVASRDMV